jgi:hypothetical protein
MNKNDKQLLDDLYKQDKRGKDKHVCHYCGIRERDFLKLWGEFYRRPYRGRRLEIDHKDAVVKVNGKIKKRKKAQLEDTAESCVLACALCNMAKSNMFTHREFEKVGKVIREIWQERRTLGLTVEEGQD